MSKNITRCLQSGLLEKVSAGEVCTLDTAKNLGIDNIIKNKHFLPEYSEIKTYNNTIDTKENRYAYSLCDINTSGSESTPICPLQKDTGFGFTKKYDPSTKKYMCFTAECPTSFTQKDDKCMKPKISKTTVINNKIDERWYDWFVIPDYHLGNKYANVGDKNYNPCIKGSVPYYTTDPVDGAVRGYTYALSKQNHTNKCISRDKYFEGKYNDSPYHCPLSWVMRAGATKEDYKKIYKGLIDEIEQNAYSTDDLKKIKADMNTVIQNDIYAKIEEEGYTEDADTPPSIEAEYACKKLYNNSERMKKAYEICTNIEKEDKNVIIKKFIEENADNDMKKATTKYIRARQACHTVFCDPSGDSLIHIEGSKKLCYPDIEKQNIATQIALAEKTEKDFSKPIDASNGIAFFIDVFVKTACLLIGVIVFIFLYVTFNKGLLPAFNHVKQYFGYGIVKLVKVS